MKDKPKIWIEPFEKDSKWYSSGLTLHVDGIKLSCDFFWTKPERDNAIKKVQSAIVQADKVVIVKK